MAIYKVEVVKPCFLNNGRRRPGEILTFEPKGDLTIPDCVKVLEGPPAEAKAAAKPRSGKAAAEAKAKEEAEAKAAAEAEAKAAAEAAANGQ